MRISSGKSTASQTTPEAMTVPSAVRVQNVDHNATPSCSASAIPLTVTAVPKVTVKTASVNRISRVAKARKASLRAANARMLHKPVTAKFPSQRTAQMTCSVFSQSIAPALWAALA